MTNTTTNAGEFRSNSHTPPRSHDEALSIIKKARERLGKFDTNRTPAQQLVRDNLAIITELRDRGHRQEDAILLILEVSNDAHKPDTIRKAIRAVVGDWLVTPVNPGAASHSDDGAADGSVNSAPSEPTSDDDEEGVMVL